MDVQVEHSDIFLGGIEGLSPVDVGEEYEHGPGIQESNTLILAPDLMMVRLRLW